MPAESQAQRGYLFAKFGAAWVKRNHFDNKGPLPAHVAPQKPVFTPSAALRRRKKG